MIASCAEVWLRRPPRLGTDCWVVSPAYLAPPDLGCSPQGVLQRQPTALLGSTVTRLPGAAAGALPPLICQSTGFYWAPPSYGVVSGAGDGEVMETGAAWTVSELTALRRGRGRREERLTPNKGSSVFPTRGCTLCVYPHAEQKGAVQGHFPEAVRRKVPARYQGGESQVGKSWILTLREGPGGLEPRAREPLRCQAEPPSNMAFIPNGSF